MSRLHSQFPGSNLSVLHTHGFPQFYPTKVSSVWNLLVLLCFLSARQQWTALLSTEDWSWCVFPPISQFSHVLNLQKWRITGSHPLRSWSLQDIYCTSEFHSKCFSPFLPAWLSHSCENGCGRFCSRCRWRSNFMWMTRLVQAKKFGTASFGLLFPIKTGACV